MYFGLNEEPLLHSLEMTSRMTAKAQTPPRGSVAADVTLSLHMLIQLSANQGSRSQLTLLAKWISQHTDLKSMAGTVP